MFLLTMVAKTLYIFIFFSKNIHLSTIIQPRVMLKPKKNWSNAEYVRYNLQS